MKNISIESEIPPITNKAKKNSGEKYYPDANRFLQDAVFVPAHAYSKLKELALEEPWSLGGKNNDAVLKSYFKYTFFKAILDKKYKLSADSQAFVINTGLVGEVAYDPIYAVFVRNPQPKKQPLALLGFFVGGNRLEPTLWGFGKNYDKSYFPEEPERIDYLEESNTIDVRKLKQLSLGNNHIIVDNFSRFPLEFILKGLPGELEAKVKELHSKLKTLYKKDEMRKSLTDDLRELMKTNSAWVNEMNYLLTRSIDRAIARVEWNRATAIPTYYPTNDVLTFLLPLAFQPQSEHECFDLALAVSYGGHGSVDATYKAYTVFTLEMAFNNARLVNRPASDWLRPEVIS